MSTVYFLDIQTNDVCLPSSTLIIIDFINVFLSYRCMMNTFWVLTEVSEYTLCITCIMQLQR